MHLRLGIAGGGRAAWAFGSSWRRIGAPIAGLWLREGSASRIAELLDAPLSSPEQIECDLLLLAVSDRAIDEVAARFERPDRILFHASGSLPATAGGFSLHPLRALPPVGEPSDLRDTLLVFEGSHRETALAISSALEARFAEISREEKIRYHAGAVFGSNYVAAVMEIASRLIGIPGTRDDVAALAASAVENWRAHDTAARFTGPASRGDLEVMQRHLEALRDDPQVADLYKLLAAEIARAILATQK